MDRSILAGRWHGRKIALMVALAAALLVLFASAAYAAHVEGTNGPDVLVGTAHQDTLIAKGGADTVKGLKGSDTLLGGGGDDVLIGGPGPDVLRGGYGDDNLYGGPDNTQGPKQGAD